jgi:dolichol-phosphate mannosyltransferase
MKLSVVIPAHNEQGCIKETVVGLLNRLRSGSIESEILIVNDHSTDSTENILEKLSKSYAEVRFINNTSLNGFGNTVRLGLENFTGDAVAIVMADGSDDPNDVVKFFHKLDEGYDCVFGSRFIKSGKTHGYPKFKLIVNRMTNLFISALFGMRYNDTTNAFKMYRREMIKMVAPLVSQHFNLTVELSLKAIIRGCSYAVLPNTWRNRKSGVSKLKLKKMGSRYLFTILDCFIEKWRGTLNCNRRNQIQIHRD